MMLQLKMNYKRVNTYFFVRDTTINYHEQQADTGKQMKQEIHCCSHCCSLISYFSYIK